MTRRKYSAAIRFNYNTALRMQMKRSFFFGGRQNIIKTHCNFLDEAEKKERRTT